MESEYVLHTGKSEIVLKDYPDNYFDSIVTDGPYALNFMGKSWDNYGARQFQDWMKMMSSEFFRVLKPGGYFLNFSSPRTYHRMACGVEEAGFEIRDQMLWIFASGFPKSYNGTAWELHLKSANLYRLEKITDIPRSTPSQATLTEGKIQDSEYPLLFVQSSYLQTPVYACSCCLRVLQPYVPCEDHQAKIHREAWSESKTCWSEQSIMERWSDPKTTERKLQRCQVCQMSHGIFADGAKGWLHNDAPISNGVEYWKIIDEDGGGSSFRSRSIEQRDQQLKTLLLECRAQAVRGHGTALKPAHEPIVVARKPIIGTTAKNYEEFGVGCFNIDGCRVHGGGNWKYGNQPKLNGARYQPGQLTPLERHAENVEGGDEGRWPANIIHDGSPLIIDQFPESKGQQGRVGPEHGEKKSINTYGEYGVRPEMEPRSDSGSAARFFYCAKTSPLDRNEGLPDGILNDHPTVKPTDLMRYLIRLVTPKGGIVCDPFRGSGSTGKAAMLEHMKFVGIDMDEKWEPISRYRIEHALRTRDIQIPLFS